MSAIIYLILGFIPPRAAGPLAGIALIEILKRRKSRQLWLFWPLLVLLNLLILYWVASSAPSLSSIASLSAFIGIPLAAVLTVPVMRRTRRRLESAGTLEPSHKLWFTIGLVLIPALQVSLFVAFLVLAPRLCKAGWLFCQGG